MRNDRDHRRRLAALTAGIALAASLVWLTHAGTAHADRSPDDLAAERALAEAKTAEAGVTEPEKRAAASLERAKRFRESGDEPRARLAEAAGRAWAEAARELVRTGTKEREAAAKVALLADAGAGATRERALLEETQLANERLRAQIDQAKRDKSAPGDAGASKIAPPKPKKAGGDAR